MEKKKGLGELAKEAFMEHYRQFEVPGLDFNPGDPAVDVERLPNGRTKMTITGEIAPVAACVNDGIAMVAERLAKREYMARMLNWLKERDADIPDLSGFESFGDAWAECWERIGENYDDGPEQWEEMRAEVMGKPVSTRFFTWMSVEAGTRNEKIRLESAISVDSPYYLPQEANGSLASFRQWLAAQNI